MQGALAVTRWSSLVSGAAHSLLSSLREIDPQEWASLARRFCDYEASRVIVPPGSYGGLTVILDVAATYLTLGRPNDALRVCTQAAEDSRCESKGVVLVKAAEAATKIDPPNWELALLTLERAVETGDVPAPAQHLLQDRLNEFRQEWLRKAGQALPKSRLAGYLTLWQRGLTERMATYWTDALRDELKAEARALAEPARRPVKVGEIATAEGSSDGGKAALTVALKFPAGSPNPTGQWVFRLVGDQAGVPWLIDRIDPPAPHP
jgi:hypothetical protein